MDEYSREFHEFIALLEAAEQCRNCQLPILSLGQLCPGRTPDYPLCIPVARK